MNSRLLRSWRVTALAVFLALTLSACGGSSNDPAPPVLDEQPTVLDEQPTVLDEQPTVPNGSSALIASVMPGGPVQVTIGQRISVSITFRSSDSRPLTNLRITSGLSPLPAEWNTANSTFECASVTQDGACRLELTYAPTVVVPDSSFTLNYSFIGSDGSASTDAVSIVYKSTVATLAYVANNDDNNVLRCIVDADSSLNSCRPVLEAANPTAVALNGTWAYIARDDMTDVIDLCDVDVSGIFANCRDSGATGLGKPYSLQVYGSRMYAANADGFISWCTIGTDGSLSDCRGQGDPILTQPFGLAIQGSRFFVTDTNTSKVNVCDFTSDGGFDSCRDTGATLANRPEGLAVSGSRIYFANAGDRSVTQCTIDDSGDLSGCSTAVTFRWTPIAIAISGARAFITQASDSKVLTCDVQSGELTNCRDSGANSLNYPLGITLR